MRLLTLVSIPLLILVTAGVYWFLTYEWAGSVLLFIFAIAMGVMIWVLGPTLNDVGPTAPVDPDWHEHRN